MKSAISQIIGKTISGVLVKESQGGDPTSQAFLVFDDNTYYELYSSRKICGASGVDPGGMKAAKEYMANREIILEAGS
jgi:hypothetical protein